MNSELLIFVGHSDDAKAEAEAIHTLEIPLLKFLRKLKNLSSLKTSVKIFLWENDANLGVGGQNYAINPFLEESDIGLFVFKEKIGAVTWQELRYCIQNKIKTIAIFPKAPPFPEKLNDADYVKQWGDLIDKKDSLNEDWSSEESNSVTKIDPYTDETDLKEILYERLSDLIPLVISEQVQRNGIVNQYSNVIDSTSIGFSLSNPSATLDYSEKLVTEYKDKLRKEHKSKLKPGLGNLAFIRSLGFIKNDKLTYAGVLLFNERPSNHIKSASCRASKYEGVDQSTRKKRIDVENSVFNQILICREFLEEHMDTREVISTVSSSSITEYQYPMKCIREVLANAFCHRDYSDHKRIVYVALYRDRIEVINPGIWGNKSIPDGQSIPFNKLIGRPVERNLTLAKAISAINFMEMEGSGIQTSINDCLETGAPIPQVIQEQGFITVKIFPRANWSNYSPNQEGAIEINESIVLDKELSTQSLQDHTVYIENWSKGVAFRDSMSFKSLRNIYVNTELYSVPSKSRFSEEKISRVELKDVVDSYKNNIILGRPGSGKTTALKAISHQVLTDQGAGGRFNTVILIRGRDLDNITYNDLYTYLCTALGLVFKTGGKKLTVNPKSKLSTGMLSQIKSQLISFFDLKKTLILFDGWDEIPDSKLQKLVVKELQELSYLVKKSKVILTSRTGSFDFKVENFDISEIASFNESAIADLSQKWLRSGADHFLDQLKGSAFYQDSLSPIVLVHLLAIYERNGRLPDKPKSIYRKIVLLLLEEWDLQRSIDRQSPFSGFLPERKYEFLASFSFLLTTQLKKTMFSRSDIKLIYKNLAKNYNLPENQAEKVAQELESTSGLFIQSGFDTYEFSQKSIQEFLCAEHMVMRPNSWEDQYLDLPNELAITVCLSSKPGFYLINIVRHLMNQKQLPALFIQTFVSRLQVEKPDFRRTQELNAALSWLFTHQVLNESDPTRLRQLESILSNLGKDVLTQSIDDLYMEISRASFSSFAKSDYSNYNDIPEGFKYYIPKNGTEKPQILKGWPKIIRRE